LVASNNICGTVIKWYQSLAQDLNVPMFLLDAPFQHERGPSDHAIQYVAAQLEELISWVAHHTGRKLNDKKFHQALHLSNQAVTMWREIRELCQARPSPLNAPDLFITMAPIVVLRGTQDAVTFYRKLKDEVEERVERGEGAILEERYRLLWDNIAIWYRLYRFFRPFMDAGVCFVTDGYTNAWATAEPVDLDDPLPSMARALQAVYINLDLETRATIVADLAQRFDVDGMVMHANWSCKPFSLTQSDIQATLRERMSLPTLVLEADMCDSRRYNEGAAKERIAAFLEMLE
jgi:benzoyl-CoA reductase/2-hydroxyglutaryl-CoA dehydratase subunit BcrC/BadD/HgdB